MCVIWLRKPLNRRFIIVEGVYAGSGDIAPMGEIFKLKEEFCYRLVVDESNALGVLGKRGRGACEHFGLQPQQVEIVTATMGASSDLPLGKHRAAWDTASCRGCSLWVSLFLF